MLDRLIYLLFSLFSAKLDCLFVLRNDLAKSF